MDSRQVGPGFYQYDHNGRHIVVSEYDHNAIHFRAMRIDWTQKVPQLCVTDAAKMSEYVTLTAEDGRRKYALAQREEYLEALQQEGSGESRAT